MVPGSQTSFIDRPPHAAEEVVHAGHGTSRLAVRGGGHPASIDAAFGVF
jgi:hypothetical protein